MVLLIFLRRYECNEYILSGYYPVQIGYDEANELMNTNPIKFKELVQESLRRHVQAVNYLCSRGMHFWDYGNAFLLEVHWDL